MTEADVRAGIALLVLLALGVAALTYGRVPRRRDQGTALLRALVQLAALGLVVHAVFVTPALVAVLLAVMLGVAVLTSTRRLNGLERPGLAVLAACLAGAVPAVGLVLASGALAVTSRNVVGLGGIVIGGAMAACTLTGRGLLAGLRSDGEQVEGALALGATMRQAVAPIARRAVGDALVPNLDQTRTVGLVTLPGTYVGALLGGASPTDAARYQLLVLAALLCAQAIAGVVLAQLLGSPRTLPEGAQSTREPKPPHSRSVR